MPRSKGWLLLGLPALLLIVTATLVAQPAEEDAATPAVQARRASRLAALDAPGRAAFAKRMAAWDALSPLERLQQRGAYADWRALDPATRQRLQQAAATLATLPPAQQQAMAARFAALDAAEQAGWRLGPDVGADYARLYPLLAFMPEAERQPMRQVLQQMSAPQRADLAVLTQRTPPQERDALRQGLIATTSASRAQWLHEQLSR
ncbi:Protein of unknown function [Pseudoxanthomonas sp. GM95]|uniref:DUF3106 domain-containing protein n=1 Tax=Pseudoxanthomonas sp. GM95 TaxID=1881043 RepID=UPI0008D87FBA|nr:DUF3106 domain-containing protein [Pseudoxanthomonas sp. GM95]SEL54502.1 Protein of unknown function [Pseudoxanthomonas sp. GM95]